MKIPIVVMDTVLLSQQSSVTSLAMLREHLLPKVTLMVSTVNEVAILLDRKIESLEDIKHAAKDLNELGTKYVLIRSEIISSDSTEKDIVLDVLFDGVDFTFYKNRISVNQRLSDTRSISSATMTSFLAYGLGIKQAIEDSIPYTRFVSQFLEKADEPSSVDEKERKALVESHLWIKEPCTLSQTRSFTQLLKNTSAKEWVRVLL